LKIPVIDIFAGPGGLGEGFSTSMSPDNTPAFDVRLSIEKDSVAFRTLTLRSFYRQFKDNIPNEYYLYLMNEISREELFNNKKYKEEVDAAYKHVWQAELGAEAQIAENADAKIKERLGSHKKPWVLIGGPPCQAYSLVGRARMRGADTDKFNNDHRHFLYKEYLRILARHMPDVFIFENVKGMLSSKVNGHLIFDTIFKDLRFPVKSLENTELDKKGSYTNLEYNIYSFLNGESEVLFQEDFDSRDFVVKAEKYGIPQTRHRVILLGVRSDIKHKPDKLKQRAKCNLWDIIGGVPKIRSALSKEPDSLASWIGAIQTISKTEWYESIPASSNFKKTINESLKELKTVNSQGSEFVSCQCRTGKYDEWYIDKRLPGLCNHSSRSHIRGDLKRYFFASCFAKENRRTPRLSDFPEEFLPNHKNVQDAIKNGKFADRFRVQLKNEPSKTITSHIGKDGHYFIHPDSAQCRSLTVREAARLQTFPDNYFFEGPRTQQYAQVGNAVPPLLARDIADIVYDLLKRAGTA